MAIEDQIRSRLVELLTERGISRRGLAKRLGKTPQWAGRIFSGEIKITLQLLDEIVAASGIESAALWPPYTPPIDQSRQTSGVNSDLPPATGGSHAVVAAPFGPGNSRNAVMPSPTSASSPSASPSKWSEQMAIWLDELRTTKPAAADMVERIVVDLLTE